MNNETEDLLRECISFLNNKKEQEGFIKSCTLSKELYKKTYEEYLKEANEKDFTELKIYLEEKRSFLFDQLSETVRHTELNEIHKKIQQKYNMIGEFLNFTRGTIRLPTVNIPDNFSAFFEKYVYHYKSSKISYIKLINDDAFLQQLNDLLITIDERRKDLILWK